MYIYTISGGFNKPDLVFSSYKNAQQAVIRNLRATAYQSPTTFGEINMKRIDSNTQTIVFKYRAGVRDFANLRFLHVEFERYSGISQVIDEVMTNWTVYDDRELVHIQMEDYKHSSPKFIYYNDVESIKNRSDSEFIGKSELMENIDPQISNFFKFRSYCYRWTGKDK